MMKSALSLVSTGILLSYTVTAAGCAPGEDVTGGEPLIKPEQLKPSNSPTLGAESRQYNPAMDEEMNQEQQVDAAIEDLAARLNVDKAEVRVSDVKSVTWRSGALGCPEPGKMYTQALVPGLRIKLNANGSDYQYHSAAKSEPFLCPAARIESPAAGANLSDI